MATTVPIQFAQHSYEARSGVTSVQRLQNLYLEANPQEAKHPTALVGTPGLKLWSTVGDGPIRGLHAMGNDLFVVSANELYSVNIHKTATLIGAVDDSGNVHMNDNGTHVGIATRSTAYAANNDEIIVLAEGQFNGATYQDGYGIFTQKNGQLFWITNIDDMTTIGATDFSSADSASDNVQGCISDHRELWIFKDRTIEIWYNSGAADFPFTRANAGFIERGTVAHGSIAKEDNTVFWLGDDYGVYQARGYQPQRISTPAIEKLITAQSDPEAAWAFTYRQEGHVFYVLTFSSLTICYDTTTGRWHERQTKEKNRWSANTHAFQFEKNLVGDFEGGQVYELDLDTYTDNGTAILREAVTPPLHNQGSLLSISEFYVDMEMGVGITTGQGDDPTLMLDWTDNFGKTWASQRDADAGKIGEYMRRARWLRLGAAHQRSIRLQISDPVKTNILTAYARMEPHV